MFGREDTQGAAVSEDVGTGELVFRFHADDRQDGR